MDMNISELDNQLGGRLSGIIIEEVRKRYEWSNRVISKRIGKWREIDNVLTTYIPDEIVSSKLRTNNKEKTLVFNIPMSLAIKDLFLTTLYNIFLRGKVIHYIKGVGKDINARIKGALLERVIARQDLWFKKRLKLDVIFGHAITYGIGRGCVRWTKRLLNRINEDKLQATQLLGMLSGIGGIGLDLLKNNSIEQDILFEGSEIVPIHPYNIITDPNVPLYSSTEPEYQGWIWTCSKYELLKLQRDPENMFFNCENIETDNSYTGIYNTNNTNNAGTREKPVECISMCIRIIPNEFFKVNFISDKVENWMFTVANEKTVIQAFKLPYAHGNFPIIDLTVSDTDTVFPVSKLESIYPFQVFASWLLKSRADSIINSINGKIIVDNSKVNIDDILNPTMGNIIRLKNTAYGDTDIRRYITQLQFQDITQQYLNDITILDALTKQGTGATDIMFGDMSKMPERPTQLGINAIINASYGRISRIAMIINEMFMRELGYQMCFNTQQFMSKEVFVPIAGYRYEQELKKEFGTNENVSDLLVDPELIKNIYFEIEPTTNIEPHDTDTQALVQLMQILMQNPQASATVMANYDLARIFATVMRKLGIENLEDYKIEVKPDEQILEQQQQGNLIPVEKPNPTETITGD